MRAKNILEAEYHGHTGPAQRGLDVAELARRIRADDEMSPRQGEPFHYSKDLGTGGYVFMAGNAVHVVTPDEFKKLKELLRDMNYAWKEEEWDREQAESKATAVVNHLLERGPGDPVSHEIIKDLAARGITAHYEFPGYIDIPFTQRPGGLAVGTVDGFWGCDVHLDHEHADLPADVAGEYWEKFIDRPEADTPKDEVLAAIEATYKKVNVAGETGADADKVTDSLSEDEDASDTNHGLRELTSEEFDKITGADGGDEEEEDVTPGTTIDLSNVEYDDLIELAGGTFKAYFLDDQFAWFFTEADLKKFGL